jgi:2-polyprenyl-3-methyl-5-hydroxy-6-metoxy-1,4-benzoquinol methylase
MIKQRTCETCGGNDFRGLFQKQEHDFFRCRVCGLIRIDPQPADEVLSRIYGSQYYDAWGVKNGAERVRCLKKLTFKRHVLSQLNLKPGSRILDCGAAFGALMEAAQEMGSEPYGIELAAEAAAAIAQRFGPDRVFSGRFEQAAFPGMGEQAFDAVFMCDFIEHVRDPLTVLRKATRLLKPGGFLTITTPDGGSLSRWLMGAGWPHYKVEHLYYFNRQNLAQLLKQVGVSLTFSGPAWKVLDLLYIQRQFNAYPRAVTTPAINFLTRCLGSRLSRSPLSFHLGEMIATGTKE